MMTGKEVIQTSRFLSLVLRHEPERVGLILESSGWVGVNELLEALNRNGVALTLDQLKHIVAHNDKKRFTLSEDGRRIRASQGHSVDVDLQYTPQTPPEVLYHGTVDRFLDSIRKTGLQRLERHHVHLHTDTTTALRVGSRRGKPVLLTIRAGDMHRAGQIFYLSTSGVWLVDQVPPRFIEFPS